MTTQPQDLWELFPPNQSPYYAMYTAGIRGIPIEVISAHCNSVGIPLRTKDVENWQAGYFKHTLNKGTFTLNPRVTTVQTRVPFEKMKLEDFRKFPEDWAGTNKRWFPCSIDNKPLNKWGWPVQDMSKPRPSLYNYTDAKVLSPCGWVGQNMLYQPFIVMDIDGAGHGEYDPYVIQFGNLFKDKTLCYEDPAKPGSFHLYFATDRIIPVKHFPFAKLDLMGNAVNAAVYLKNKKPNGLGMMPLNNDVWWALVSYINWRKSRQKGLKQCL